MEATTPKTDWGKRLKDMGWPDDFKFDFDVNEWGSCQYSSALRVYRLYFEMRQQLDREEVLKRLGIQFSHLMSDPLAFKSAEQRFLKDTEKRYREWSLDSHMAGARRANSYDDVFYCRRNWAWDLWGAAPYVMGLAYPNFQLTGVPKSAGFGPVGNAAVQSDNIFVGLCCAILKDTNVVASQDSFKHFDT